MRQIKGAWIARIELASIQLIPPFCLTDIRGISFKPIGDFSPELLQNLYITLLKLQLYFMYWQLSPLTFDAPDINSDFYRCPG